ncbi:hypothetical protein D9756_008628 [Leucocoprinus leucothites]|uniref:Alcohol dehydrogenase-like C-terminal domain-containing protein n=1 Tax=Leucocoprinus leucothites TaxID=201217 RepID=A0A8H5FVB0_9AGAR|nr:hypothetical protein D9756_008628 [Leucoagaricus leucothites]
MKIARQYGPRDVRVEEIDEPEPVEVAACIESVATAWHAVKRANFNEGDTALILGGGPTALFILRVLRSAAPTSFILVSESSPARRTLALKHGASEVLDPSNTHFGATGIIYKATAGFGVHAVFDTVGTQSSVDSALLCLRTGGTLVNMAVWKTNVMVNMNFMFKEITVTGAMAYDNVHAEVIEAVAGGHIQGIEELITDSIQIEDVVKKGYLELLNKGDEHIKILVRPHEPPPPPPEGAAQESSSDDTEPKDEALAITTSNKPAPDESDPTKETARTTTPIEQVAAAAANAKTGTFSIPRRLTEKKLRLSSIRTKFVEVID